MEPKERKNTISLQLPESSSDKEQPDFVSLKFASHLVKIRIPKAGSGESAKRKSGLYAGASPASGQPIPPASAVSEPAKL